MKTEATLYRARIKRWEMLRLPFNLICYGAGWVGWQMCNAFNVGIDEMPAALLSDPGVAPRLIVGFVLLNLAYCLVYALEYLLLSISPDRPFRVVKIGVYLAGCLLGLIIAGRLASSTALMASIEHREEIGRKTRLEQMRRRLSEPEPKSEPATPPADQRKP